MRWTTTTLVFCVGALLALGMVILYSLGMMKEGAYYLVRQSIWCGLGLIACLTMSALDYRHLKKVSLVLFVLTLVLLGLVLVPWLGISIKSHGARRWLGYGDIRFQPSELAKLVLIIVLAHYGEHFQRQMGSLRKGVLPACCLIASMLALIFLEPDRGTTIFLASIALVLLLLAGVRWLVLLIPAGLGAAALTALLWRDPLVIRRVIKGWIDMENHKLDAAYQSWAGIMAIGSGGAYGVGLGDGRLKMGFVPDQQTDFILPIVGEELGLVATMAVVATFLVFVVCGFQIAHRARDPFGFLLAFGLTYLIGLQAWINIAVVTSILPNKGLPLPFVSYGGSSLVMMLTAVGILLSIARHSSAEEIPPAGAEDMPLDAPA